MNRRNFIKAIAAGVAGWLLAPSLVKASIPSCKKCKILMKPVTAPYNKWYFDDKYAEFYLRTANFHECPECGGNTLEGDVKRWVELGRQRQKTLQEFASQFFKGVPVKKDWDPSRDSGPGFSKGDFLRG